MPPVPKRNYLRLFLVTCQKYRPMHGCPISKVGASHAKRWNDKWLMRCLMHGLSQPVIARKGAGGWIWNVHSGGGPRRVLLKTPLLYGPGGAEIYAMVTGRLYYARAETIYSLLFNLSQETTAVRYHQLLVLRTAID
eukprot:gene7876-biopygen2601